MKRLGCILLLLPFLSALPGQASLPVQPPSQEQSVPPAASASAGWTVAGVVLNAKTGAPLDRATVTLSDLNAGNSTLASAQTGASGRFRFEGMAAGKYLLSASRKGFLQGIYQEHDGIYSTAIVTGPAQDTEHLRFDLLPTAVIDGTVTDDAGDPVRGAQVALYRRAATTGEEKMMTAGMDQTDDTGAYEFPRLRPGTYLIAVSADPWYAFRPPVTLGADGNPLPEAQRSPLDVAYPTTYFPNATDRDAATPVQVRPGDRLDANFALHAVPALHLQITMPETSQGISMPQLMEDVFGLERPVGTMTPLKSTTPNQPVVEEIGGVAPGHYTLQQFGPHGEQATDAVDLTSDQAIDRSSLPEGASVSGKIVMASGAKLPSRTTVRLRSGTAWAAPAPVAEDGNFSIDHVSPGPHTLAVHAPGHPLSVLQIAVSGGKTSGDEITVGSEALLIAATVGVGTASIDGFAVRAGKGQGGAMIVLVPRDPNAPAELIRRDQTDSDGSFSVPRVLPGSYTVVAIGDGWSLEWAKPQVIAKYLPRGFPVQITDGQRMLHLPQAIEVQER